MKRIFYLIMFLHFSFLILPFAQAQEEGYVCVYQDSTGSGALSSGLSYNGYQHSPNGDLHLLIVIVRYSNQNQASSWTTLWPNDSLPLPVFAVNNTSGINDLFNESPTTISTTNAVQNLSEYYYVMSDGKFRVTADVYPVQVPVFFQFTGNLDQQDWALMNKEAMEWITQREISLGNNPDAFWAQYDNRTNTPNFQFDNSTSSPDSIIDYITFIHRNNQAGSGASGGATPIYFGDSDWTITNTSYKVRDRCGHTQGENSVSKFRQWDFFTHEFAHNLYRSPHYFGANSVIGDFMTCNYGWGMMSQSYAQFFTANAFERWWLDWVDTVFTVSPGPQTVIQLRDLTTFGEAARIEIPNSNGQYVWLEVHDSISHWDTKQDPLGQSFAPRMSKGVYAYYSGNWDRSGGSIIRNGFKLFSAEGRFDIIRTLDSIYVPYVGGLGSYQKVFNQDARKPNQFSGLHSTEDFIFDKNGNGSISIGTGSQNAMGTERDRVFAERISGIDSVTYAATGDRDDAWQIGDILGLEKGFPIANYSPFNGTSQQLTSPYYLNGLQISLLSYNPVSQSYLITVSYDNYDIDSDQRWCGNLVWNENKTLRIQPGRTVELDLGETPDRTRIDTLTTQTFTNASHLSLENNAKLEIQNNSTLRVKRHSGLTINSGSSIRLKSGAKLIVEDGGWLDIKQGGFLYIEDSAQVLIDSLGALSLQNSSLTNIYGTGELKIERTADLHFFQFAKIDLHDDSSHLYLKGNLTFHNSAIMRLEGDGYWRFGIQPPSSGGPYANNIFTESGSSSIFIDGNSSNPERVLLRIDDETSFQPDTGLVFFSLQHGTVHMGEASKIVIHKTPTNLRIKNCTITAEDPEEYFDAVALFDVGGNYTLDEISFSRSKYGLVLAPVSDPPTTVEVTNSIFSDNQWYGLWASEVPVNVSSTSFFHNDVGWEGTNQSWPNWFDESNADTNATAGIRQVGFGSFLFDESFARNNDSGLRLTGEILARGNCAVITNNGFAGVDLYSGAMLDVSALPRENFSWSDLSYNYHTIYLDDAGATLLVDGYNDLEPLPAGPNTPRVLLGTQRFKGVQTFSAEKNHWNLLNQSPVSGLDYDVISSTNSQDLYYVDGRPETLGCGEIPSNYNRAEEPLMDCRTCEDVEVQINPAYGSGGSTVTIPLDSAVRDAISNLRLYDPLGDDWEAAWRFYQILGHDYSHVNADEEVLLGLGFSYLMQAMSGACANGEVAVSDDESLVLDNLSDAVLSLINDSLDVDRPHKDWLRWASAKAGLYAMVRAMEHAEAQMEDLYENTSGDEREFFDIWLCHWNAKKNFRQGFIDVDSLLDKLHECSNPVPGRKRNPLLGFASLPSSSKEAITIFPNPASNYVHLKIPSAIAGQLTFQVYDLVGRLIDEQVFQGLEIGSSYVLNAPVGSYSRGMFIFRIQHGTLEQSQRVYLE
jgi:M6 family metalloprotease-like protein